MQLAWRLGRQLAGTGAQGKKRNSRYGRSTPSNAEWKGHLAKIGLQGGCNAIEVNLETEVERLEAEAAEYAGPTAEDVE